MPAGENRSNFAKVLRFPASRYDFHECSGLMLSFFFGNTVISPRKIFLVPLFFCILMLTTQLWAEEAPQATSENLPKMADLTQKETSLLEELDKWERWLEQATEETRKGRQRVAELQKLSEDAEKEYKNRVEQMKTLKKRVVQRLRAAYMTGRVAEAEFLFGSEGVADYSLRNFYMNRLMKHDEQTFRSYFDSVAEARFAHDKSLEAKAQAEQTVQKLEQKLAVMQQGVAHRKSMLKEIRGSEKLRRRYEKERKKASRELARKIRKMPEKKREVGFRLQQRESCPAPSKAGSSNFSAMRKPTTAPYTIAASRSRLRQVVPSVPFPKVWCGLRDASKGTET